jgi:hypothetical protein
MITGGGARTKRDSSATKRFRNYRRRGAGPITEFPRPQRPALFLLFFVGDPRLHQFPHQSCRQRLVHGEVDGAFGGREILEFVLQDLDHGSSPEQTAMVRKGGVPQQRSFVLKRRNSIADGFRGLRGHSGTNRCANFAPGAARGLQDAREAFVHVHRSATAFRGRPAIAGIHFFIGSIYQKAAPFNPTRYRKFRNLCYAGI